MIERKSLRPLSGKPVDRLDSRRVVPFTSKHFHKNMLTFFHLLMYHLHR